MPSPQPTALPPRAADAARPSCNLTVNMSNTLHVLLFDTLAQPAAVVLFVRVTMLWCPLRSGCSICTYRASVLT